MSDGLASRTPDFKIIGVAAVFRISSELHLDVLVSLLRHTLIKGRYASRVTIQLVVACYNIGILVQAYSKRVAFLRLSGLVCPVTASK